MAGRGEILLGIGGVPPGDTEAAYRWQGVLHWPMIGIALLSLPAVYLAEFPEGHTSGHVARALEWTILVAFAGELAVMLWFVRQKGRFLLRNWLDVVIVVFSLASVLGAESEWVALARLSRLALEGVVVARVAGGSRGLFRRGGLPYVFALGFVALLTAGAGFWWLEPTVRTFADGLWLAFVTGATVGYGDFVPTTTASRLFAVFIVMVGFGILSVMTASIAAMLIGEDETRLRHELHRDIRALRAEMATLIGEDETRLRREMHRDIRQLRTELARLITEEERAVLRELRTDVRALREDLDRLRTGLRQDHDG
jgi:voltage-gated potassium channel